jgi:cell wall-associated NlpC family hydrolase
MKNMVRHLMVTAFSTALLLGGFSFTANVHATTVTSTTTAKIVNGVNFRIEPSTSGQIIRLLAQGETVDIIAKVNNYWYKIKDKNGKIGYVTTSTKYIEPYKTVTTTTGTIVHSVSFRTGPSTSYKVIRYLQVGDKVQVLDKYNSYWYKVKAGDGTIGYVSTSATYIKVTTTTATVPATVPTQAPAPTTTLTAGQKAINAGKKYLGTPYEFGSNRSTTTTFDCSDFVRQAYWDAIGVHLPTDSRSQGALVKSLGNSVTSWQNLKVGDLMFFMEYKGSSKSDYSGIIKSKQTIRHVAMYMGNGKMLHTYSKASGGVRIDTIGNNSWEYRFLYGGSPLN